MITRIALWALAVLVPFSVWYVLKGRAWLKPKPWMQWLYRSRLGEWAEVNLFSKSESIFWARTLQVVGYTLTAIVSLGGVDLTPIAAVLPEGLQWLPPVMPLIISAAGHIQVQLRKDTTLPLPIVALPEAAITPEVKEKIDDLQKVKTETVAVAEQAVAEVKETA